MATKNIIYKICSFIPSCLHGKAELQVGERVSITLQPKNPLWPSELIASVIATEATYGGRVYTFEFDDADLNGGPLFEGCDVISVDPYCCCDELRDHVIANVGGTGKVSVHNFDGSSLCVVACPPDGLPEGYVPSIGPDGEIFWEPPKSVTYELSKADQPFATEITLTGSDGSSTTVSIPELNDGVPTPGTYSPDAAGIITIPITKTDFSTGGVPALVGNLVVDLRSLVAQLDSLSDQVISGFWYDPATNLYQITLVNGTSFTASGTNIDTSVVGQVTIIGPNGESVTLSTQDVYVDNLTYDPINHRYVIHLSNGSSFSAPATWVDTLVPGSVTIVGPDGGSITLPTQDIHVNGYNFQAATGYTITLTDGSSYSVPATTVDTSVSGVVTITGPDGDSVTLPISGDGSGIAQLDLVPDPTEPCSNELRLTSNDGTVRSVGGIANENTIVVDPSSTEHTATNGDVFNGLGFEGENATANGGVYLPVDGAEVRGTGPDFVKTITRKNGCSVVNQIVTGRRAGKTVVIDGDYYSDSPRFEREDHPFPSNTSVPAAVKQVAEVYRFQSGFVSAVQISRVNPTALNLTETHTVETLGLAGNFRASGSPDFGSFGIQDGSFYGSLGNWSIDLGYDTVFLAQYASVQIAVGNIIVPPEVGKINPVHLHGVRGKAVFNSIDAPNSLLALNVTNANSLHIEANYVRGGSRPQGDLSDLRPAVHIAGGTGVNFDFFTVEGGCGAVRVGSATNVWVHGKTAIANDTYVDQQSVDYEGVISIRSAQDVVFEIDRITNPATRDGPVVGILAEGSVIYKSCQFYQNLPGVDQPVIALAFGNGSTIRDVTFDNCVAYVAEPETPLFFQLDQVTRVGISGTFKSNSTNLGTLNGTFLVVNGTIELGATLP